MSAEHAPSHAAEHGHETHPAPSKKAGGFLSSLMRQANQRLTAIIDGEAPHDSHAGHGHGGSHGHEAAHGHGGHASNDNAHSSHDTHHAPAEHGHSNEHKEKESVTTTVKVVGEAKNKDSIGLGDDLLKSLNVKVGDTVHVVVGGAKSIPLTVEKIEGHHEEKAVTIKHEKIDGKKPATIMISNSAYEHKKAA